jgi:predicted CXXCH cytochrome family protein
LKGIGAPASYCTADAFGREAPVYRLLVLAAVWWLAFPFLTAAQDNQVCLGCHQADGMTVTFPDGGELSATIDPRRFASSVHASFPCVTCHTAHTDYPHPPRAARTARAYRVEAQRLCATCHADQEAAFAGSVHGQGLRAGLGDVPLCTTCHTAHAVIKTATAEFRNNTPEVCGNCHADAGIMRRYGLLPVYQAYAQEFHGVTTRLYRLATPFSPSPAAVCYDCHRAHDVKRVADPASPVAGGNLLGTCRQCHERAGPLFVTAWTEHRPPGPRFATLVWLVQVFYWVLVPGTVAVLVALTALDLWSFAVRKWGGPRS